MCIRDRHNGEARKEVVYLGSLKSDFSLRMYNKTLEQRKALLDKEAIAALPERWVRWEFTCRRKMCIRDRLLLRAKQL